MRSPEANGAVCRAGFCLSLILCAPIPCVLGCRSGPARSPHLVPETGSDDSSVGRSSEGAHAETGSPAAPLQSRIQNALEKLLEPRPPQREAAVVVDNVVRAEVPCAGALGPFLQMQISEAVTRSSSLTELDRRGIDKLLEEQGRALEDIFDKGKRDTLPGRLMTADYILKATYIDNASSVTIDLCLIDVGTGEKRSTTVSMEKADLPERIPPTPANWAHLLDNWDALGLDPVSKKDFDVRLSLDRGDGAVYRLGEELRITFRADRDCYLKLYHIAEQGIQLLFPNKWHLDNLVPVGSVLRIPSKDMGFRYRVGRPLGTEIILALASSEQFAGIDALRQEIRDVGDGGLRFLPMGEASKEGVKGIVIEGTNVAAKQARATCLFTVVE